MRRLVLIALIVLGSSMIAFALARKVLFHESIPTNVTVKPFHYEIGCVQNRIIYDYPFFPKDAAEAKARRERRPRFRYFGKACGPLIKRDGL